MMKKSVGVRDDWLAYGRLAPVILRFGIATREAWVNTSWLR